MFVGRENELRRLDGLWKKSGSSLVTVHSASELWRALPAGAERDALARDIREA